MILNSQFGSIFDFFFILILIELVNQLFLRFFICSKKFDDCSLLLKEFIDCPHFFKEKEFEDIKYNLCIFNIIKKFWCNFFLAKMFNKL